VHRDLGPVRALILEQCGAHGCNLVSTGKARGGRVGLNEVAMQGWHVIHPPEGHAERVGELGTHARLGIAVREQSVL
jgi:hypothetical protein